MAPRLWESSNNNDDEVEIIVNKEELKKLEAILRFYKDCRYHNNSDTIKSEIEYASSLLIEIENEIN